MLILLEIDGVMLPAAGWKIPKNLEDGFPMFNQKAIVALNTVIDSSTRIILTTSHKMRFSLNQWRMIFDKRGINIEHLSRLESNSNFTTRKDEILNYLTGLKLNEDFIIIDDDSSLHAITQDLKNHSIKTSSLVGLTSELISGTALALA